MLFCWSKVLVLILLHVGSSVKSSMIGHVAEANRIFGIMTGHMVRDYVGYGNYCGPGGSGSVLDPIDECCKIHDNCYRDIQWTIGAFCNVYSASFSYGMNLQTEHISCSIERDLCRKEVCFCDRSLAVCLRNNDIYYDPSLRQSSHAFKELVQFIMGK